MHIRNICDEIVGGAVEVYQAFPHNGRVKRCMRALLGVAVLTVAAASALPTLAADDWLNLATASMTNATTPKRTNRYVCYTDGTDIVCNNPSVHVSTGGLVGVGTSSPSTLFDVEGTAQVDILKMYFSGGGGQTVNMNFD